MNKKIKVHLLVHLLVNEVAGNGNAVAADYSLQKVLKNLNIPFSHQKSHYPGELIKLAQDYANTNPTPNDILIVVGGD
ncbi:Putative uncharacterized protein [Lactobacillus helveticus CIRM-BIA 953]|uniref:DAGKc domain-containing protein n=2 Tax=Lactobacillus helveticus TaxID=1587 RepID=U4QCE8_LACHE|nr:Putative uncharacterized protein [Lactobacillus helveticus CIRM-BIA 953]